MNLGIIASLVEKTQGIILGGTHLLFRDQQVSTDFWEWFCSREAFYRHPIRASIDKARVQGKKR